MSQHGCPERLSSRPKGFADDGANQTMEVLVETLTGTAFEMTVSPSDTVLAIKSKICRVEGIPVSQQHLLFRQRELGDGVSLAAAGVCGGARLRLVLALRGGPVATRRLPAPPARHVDRDEEWVLGCGGGNAAGGGACRVTVLVFRDGERVSMVRVRRNRDGTYEPLQSAKSSSLPHLASDPPASGAEEGAGTLDQNAVTMGKMAALRQRLEDLSLRRRPRGETADIQKTRSEEVLSSSSDGPFPYADDDDGEGAFPPMHGDGNYTRYHYGCSFADRYTLLPPLSARTESAQSVASDELRLSDLSDALAGSILVKGHLEAEEEAALLEECLDGVDDCRLRHDQALPPARAHYGELAVGRVGWRSASSLAAPRPAPRRAPAPLPDLLFSSSTSELETLKRNSRILPALSRHCNREQLHLSEGDLSLPPSQAPPAFAPHPPGFGPVPANPPPPLPLAPRRRQRRIENIAEMEAFALASIDHQEQQILELSPEPETYPDRLYQLGDFEAPTEKKVPETSKEEVNKVIEKKVRIRCGFCRKRLSIATVHTCRCGAEFCAPHRYAEVHGCAYDYKAHAHAYLRRANPLVSAPKLPKI